MGGEIKEVPLLEVFVGKRGGSVEGGTDCRVGEGGKGDEEGVAG